MRRLKAIGVVLWALGICAAPGAAAAAPYDGSVPILCAPAAIMECGADGACRRSTGEIANVPPFIKVNLKAMKIGTMDEARTSAIKQMDRLDGKIILHGGEGGRGWSVIISEANGKMSGAVSAEAHGFLIFGACTPL
jgi:hypothetical protein